MKETLRRLRRVVFLYRQSKDRAIKKNKQLELRIKQLETEGQANFNVRNLLEVEKLQKQCKVLERKIRKLEYKHHQRKLPLASSK